jgi:fatty acid synthase
VLLEKDFEFNPGDRAAAQLFLDMNPTAKLIEKDGALKMVLPKGSMVRVTRALRLDRWVAGQIPRGWNASRYGIPDRIVKNVDPVTLFNLAATAEAFITMGLTPQELMTYIHPAFVGNTQGSGMGGLRSIAQLFQNYREDRDSRGDILQETLINVTAGWLVQDYIGGMGPAYNPVGACATAAVSIAAACDMLDLGRAELVVAGGFDDISIEGNLGFTWMQATARTEDMLAKGIEAKAHSRSNDCRRGGFIEGQGGATLLMSTFGKALELGLPIYGVVAMAETHTDGFATSIPSPGLGLLAMAGECGRKDSVMARALKRWGLTVDDILVSSKHDTSTLANDVNESKLLHLLHSKLGRSAGNPLVVHSQKTMIGHAKGGAAGPQAIAVLQMLQSGRIPGNPNLDNPDRVITAFKEILLTDRTLQLPFVSAGMISSLGFGHMGAAALFVNPGFAFKTLSKKDLEAYLTKLAARRKVAGKRWADRICSNAAYVSGSDPRDCEQIIFGACK